MRFIFFTILLLCFNAFSAQEKTITVSHPSQVCKSTITLSFEGNYTHLYYTTNGSIPTRNARKIDSSITINKTTALLIKAQFKTGDTLIARSYIFDTISQLPIVSITIPEEDLWDSRKGIYTRGSNAFFSDSTGHWENCNFQKKWEKAIQLVYIDTSKTEVINQACGLRIFGESTRRQPDKSLKIVARKQYGTNRFHYPFFKQKPTILAFKQLVIRTSGNDYNGTRFKDVLNAYLARNLGLDYMAYQPIRMYINGTYWGVYNLREKVNKHYLYYNHGAALDSSNIIMGRWVTQHGSRKRYKEMYDWFFKLDTMDSLAYEKAKGYFDIRNYINYRAFQIFINNVDSRGNIRYWNASNLDNKFRMILYDTDLSFGSVNKDYLAKCLSPRQTNWYNNTWSTIYFRKLMEHQEFKHDFINQYAHIMNTALHTDTIIAAVNHFEAFYKEELPRSKSELPKHFKNVPIPMEKWLNKVDHFRSFAQKRPAIARDEITRTLSKSGTFYLKIEGQHGTVNINNNYPLELPFEGLYYKNVPLPITILSKQGFGYRQQPYRIDTLLYTSKDTLVLTYDFQSIKKADKAPIKQQQEQHLVPQEKNSLLWLIAWVSIGFGGVLLIVYFKLRV
ncbi:MAG: CotH kinase family protein [Flavobacteriales bacterium]|jgi:hypothetical protein|nr:CotH kinase family protein [Flavobacteriales bacterium]